MRGGRGREGVGVSAEGADPGLIPDAVRARDLIGYGRAAPGHRVAGRRARRDQPRARVRAGSEYSVAWGDDRNDGWGEYADPGVQPPQRDPGTEAHYEYGSRAGVWRLARIFDAAGVPVTVSGAAVALELNPAVAAWMRERGHDLMGHGWRWTEAWTFTREQGARVHPARDRDVRAGAGQPSDRGTRAAGRARTRAASCTSSAASSTTPRAAPTTCPTTRSADGVPPILVIPYSKTYNDSGYPMNPGFASPRDFLDTLVMGLDELGARGRRGPR